MNAEANSQLIDNHKSERRLMKLPGGFWCELSTDELNQWQQYMYGHIYEIYRDYMTAKVFRARCIRIVKYKPDDIEQEMANFVEAEADMYEAAKAWFEDISKKR